MCDARPLLDRLSKYTVPGRQQSRATPTASLEGRSTCSAPFVTRVRREPAVCRAWRASKPSFFVLDRAHLLCKLFFMFGSLLFVRRGILLTLSAATKINQKKQIIRIIPGIMQTKSKTLTESVTTTISCTHHIYLPSYTRSNFA